MAGSPGTSPPPAAATAGTGADLLDTPAAGPAAIRGSVLRTGGYLTGILLSVASAALLVRHLGVVDFGRYVTVLSVLLVSAGLTDAGLAQIGVREYSTRTGPARDRLMRDLLGLRLVLSAASVLLATGFSAVAGYGGPLVLGTFLAGLGILAQVTQATVAVPLSAELRLGWVAVGELARQVTLVLLIVALVVAGADLVPFLAAHIPASLIALSVTAVLVRRTMPLRPSFDLARWRPLVRETLPYSAATAIGVVYFRVTIVLMSLIASALETGYFATSYRVLEALVFIPYLVVSSAFPVIARAARDDRERLEYALTRILQVAVIAGVWLTLAVVLGAQFAIDVIAGDQSQPSVEVLRIQALALIPAFVAVTAQFGLLSLRRHRQLLTANATALAIGVALTFALVPAHGAQGAAVATLIGEIFVAVASVLMLRAAHAGVAFPLRLVPRVALAAGAAGVLALIPGLPDVALVVLATAVYFGVLWALRALPAELRAALPGRSAP